MNVALAIDERTRHPDLPGARIPFNDAQAVAGASRIALERHPLGVIMRILDNIRVRQGHDPDSRGETGGPASPGGKRRERRGRTRAHARIRARALVLYREESQRFLLMIVLTRRIMWLNADRSCSLPTIQAPAFSSLLRVL